VSLRACARSAGLKKLKGLNKVKLVDASWVWTEPHSRRLKVKLTVQKEVHMWRRLVRSVVSAGAR